MSYFAIGRPKATGGWYEDYVKGWWGDAPAEETGACAPGPDFDERFCALERRKDADFAAAKVAGLTPAEWYKRQGITPAGEPLPPAGGLGNNKVVILGGAAIVAFLLFRKK